MAQRPVRSVSRWWAVAAVVWTSYVWTTRIVNAWTDDESTSRAVGATVLSASFLLLAAATAAVLVRARRRRFAGAERRVLGVLAAWTTAVWLVRGVAIALADHDLGFIVVHEVLAVVSIGLAVQTWRVARTGGEPAAGERTGGEHPEPAEMVDPGDDQLRSVAPWASQ